MPLRSNADQDHRQGDRSGLEERPDHRQILSPLARRQGPPGEDQDQGEIALGSRVPLFLRRHGRQRPFRRHQGAQRQALEQRRLRIVLQARRRQAGLLRIPGQSGRGSARLFMPRRGAGGFDRFKNDTKFHVDAKVSLRGTLNNWADKDDGWSVEGRIPWTDFLKTGGRPGPGEKWKFALCRYDYSVDFEGPEISTCPRSRNRTSTSSRITPRCFSSAQREAQEAGRSQVSR